MSGRNFGMDGRFGLPRRANFVDYFANRMDHSGRLLGVVVNDQMPARGERCQARLELVKPIIIQIVGGFLVFGIG
jgi:hypothetical protein